MPLKGKEMKVRWDFAFDFNRHYSIIQKLKDEDI